MLQSRDLRIVIPAYNEGARIEPTVRGYCEWFRNFGTIVVVANGCSDDTVEIAKSLQAEYDNLSIVEIPAKIGKGGAVRVGFATGSESLVGFVDADGSTSPREFSALADRCLGTDCEGVIGSRWMKGARILSKQPVLRRIASRTFNLMVRVLFSLPYTDTQCGAKIFKRSALEEVLQSLEVANFAFDIEVLWRLRRAGARIIEVPTTWADCQNGTKVQLARASSTMLKSIVRLRLRESFLWCLPFIDRVGHRSIIPVRRSHRFLVLGRATLPPADKQRFDEIVEALSQRGVDIVVSDLDTRAILARWRQFLAYVLRSSRDYDAIVDVGTRSSFITMITTKPAAVAIRHAPSSEAPPPEMLSRARARFSVFSDAAGTASFLTAFAEGTPSYPAVFWRKRDTLALSYAGIETGDPWQTTVLR